MQVSVARSFTSVKRRRAWGTTLLSSPADASRTCSLLVTTLIDYLVFIMVSRTHANICLYSIWLPSWPHTVSVGITHGEVGTGPWSQHLSESCGVSPGWDLGKTSQPSGAVKREEPPPWGHPSPLAGPRCLISLQGPGSELVQLLILPVLPPALGLFFLPVWCQDLAQ